LLMKAICPTLHMFVYRSLWPVLMLYYIFFVVLMFLILQMHHFNFWLHCFSWFWCHSEISKYMNLTK
jgi:hypothetical protein